MRPRRRRSRNANGWDPDTSVSGAGAGARVVRRGSRAVGREPWPRGRPDSGIGPVSEWWFTNIVGRPVETADEVLLDAADRVLLTQGPAGFALAKVAAVAGVSAATLVKRFGSKETLFLRLSQRWPVCLDAELVASAAPHASPLARLRAVALHGYHDLDNPATAVMQLAALAVHLQNEEMRALLHVGWGQVGRCTPRGP